MLAPTASQHDRPIIDAQCCLDISAFFLAVFAKLLGITCKNLTEASAWFDLYGHCSGGYRPFSLLFDLQDGAKGKNVSGSSVRRPVCSSWLHAQQLFLQTVQDKDCGLGSSHSVGLLHKAVFTARAAITGVASSLR